MRRHLEQLAGGPFDLLIIGGGIMGAGVARDAALRGLKVALIEKNDFASGASSRSSKLIHGGLRYLESRPLGRDIPLVREASSERAILRRIAPHLVKPLSLLIPIYRDSRRALWQMRIGLWLYDRLASGPIQPHRILSSSEVLAEEPDLNPNGLVGGAIYYDCQEDDARFCIENLLSATEAGAVVANYVELIGFRAQKNRLVAAKVRDCIGGETFEIAASLFVNAAGHWMDQVTQWAGVRTPPPLRRTKGTHLLLPRLTCRHGLLMISPVDGRALLALPWHQNFTLVGTTDTDFHGDWDKVYPNLDEANYLLNSLDHYLPQKNQASRQIQIAFAGLRTLADVSGGVPSQASREHRLVAHGNGLLSIVGGKFTTYRLIAEQTIDICCKQLGQSIRSCMTANQPFPIRETNHSSQKLCDDPLTFLSDVDRAVEHEMAITVCDVMWRRLGLFLSSCRGRDIAEQVAIRMRQLCGWNEQETKTQLDNYLAELEKNFPQ